MKVPKILKEVVSYYGTAVPESPGAGRRPAPITAPSLADEEWCEIACCPRSWCRACQAYDAGGE